MLRFDSVLRHFEIDRTVTAKTRPEVGDDWSHRASRDAAGRRSWCAGAAAGSVRLYSNRITSIVISIVHTRQFRQIPKVTMMSPSVSRVGIHAHVSRSHWADDKLLPPDVRLSDWAFFVADRAGLQAQLSAGTCTYTPSLRSTHLAHQRFAFY